MLADPSLSRKYEAKTTGHFIDSLTALYNYGFFQIIVDREVKLCDRHGDKFALALINLDSFDHYNKRNGILKGDYALNRLSKIVMENIRQTDIAARYDGDTIAVMLTRSEAKVSYDVVERIRQIVENEFEGALTVSAGLASYPIDAHSVDSLFAIANKALTQAKLNGKNQSFLFDSTVGKPVDDSPTILIVDDDPSNLKLARGLLGRRNYQVYTALNGGDALSIVKRTHVDLILLDIMMPDMDGYEVCRRIKSCDDTRLIPVIMLTALDDLDSKIRGLEAGADEFLTKFPNKVEFNTRIKSLTGVKRLNDNLTSLENVLFSLVNVVEAKDPYTKGHTKRVANLSLKLARRMGLSSKEQKAIQVGGMLHDIGKIGVSADILNKKGLLDSAEREIMEGHAEEGYKICLPLKKNLGQALDIIRHHHEKLDGSGYPDGLKADQISTPVRIMSVVDIYDALVTDRPYRSAMSQNEARAIIDEEVINGKLDKDIAEMLYEAVNRN